MEQLPKVIHESWHPHLSPLFQSSEMSFIKNNLLQNCEFLPDAKNIFNVFSMPVSDIKVVILGQDPYPTFGKAIGYAFAVSKDTSKPPSLRIIEKEVGHKIDRTLKPWREQGVFLLNTALTVQRGNPSSHLRFWKGFTSSVIRIIAVHATPIWLLWGNYAKNYSSIIETCNQFENQVILKAPHPASEIYSGYKSGFIGCGHFDIANAILKNKNKEQIKF